MLLCAAFGYHLYTSAYNKLLFESMASSLSVTSKQISQKLENAEYISSLILSSSVIQKELANQPPESDSIAVAEYNRTVNNLLTEYSALFRTNGISYAVLYGDTYTNSTNWALLNKTPFYWMALWKMVSRQKVLLHGPTENVSPIFCSAGMSDRSVISPWNLWVIW